MWVSSLAEQVLLSILVAGTDTKEGVDFFLEMVSNVSRQFNAS